MRLPDAAGKLGRCFAAGVAAKQLRKEGKSLEGALGSELAVSSQVLQRIKLNKVEMYCTQPPGTPVTKLMPTPQGRRPPTTSSKRGGVLPRVLDAQK